MNYENYLSKYNELKHTLLNTPSISFNSDIERLFGYIESEGFLELPASLNHHLNSKGGLLIHSVNVAEQLIDMTEKLNLKWEREESPIIIGLFHDLCKLEFYTTDGAHKFKHNDNPKFNLGGHGSLSIILAQKFIRFTDEEIHCIRFHMGAYEQRDWSMLDDAIKKYPNVLYTHMADMISSKIIER